jgi:putative colanic acid biosynthesis acetyltransferase WcaF
VALEAVPLWPYSFREYAARAIWAIIWPTVWQLCYRRLPILRSTILRLFGANVHPTAIINRSVRIARPWDLSIGQRSTVGPRTHLYNLGGIQIGSQTVISQDVYLCGGTHDYTDPTYPLIRKKIVIDDYVWIAAGAFIGPGVTIGQGAVVGARAVVMKDVEPWTVVAGNPACVIKQRVMKTKPGNGNAQPRNPND